MSGGSSSSENTPLLNGSHEGPCYAYSYTQSREDEERGKEESYSSKSILNLIQKIVLILLFIFYTVSLSFVDASDIDWNSSFASRGRTNKINITADMRVIHLKIRSPYFTNDGSSVASFSLSKLLPDGTYEKISHTWTVLLDIQSKEESILVHDFYLSDEEISINKTYQLVISTNARYVPFSIDVTTKSNTKKVILAICMIILFHLLLIFKILPHALAATVISISGISLLAIVDQRPSLHEVVSWIDVETLGVVFGMLFIASMLCDSGVFQLIAVMMYKLFGGQTWILMTSLFLSSAVLSALLDPFTTLILMTALAIRLCEAMNIDPKHILIALVMFSNIGSVLGNFTFRKYQTSMIEYGQFALHISPVVLLVVLATLAIWILRYRDVSSLRFKKQLEVEEVQREMDVWKKSYNSISAYSREEESVKVILERKMEALETLLRRKLYDTKIPIDDYRTTLTELSNTMKRENKYLLYKSCAVMVAVIILLLLRNVPHVLHVSSGWSAIVGAFCLMVLDDNAGINRMEWSTLLFLASYYIFNEVLVKLGLVRYLVHEAQYFITGVGETYSLLISLIFIVWVSALSSSIALPFSAAMIELIKDEDCTPLIFALALGASFGANGSILGGATNIISAGIAEHHGFRISYWDFFKIGFPFMVLATTLSMIYLLICHIWLEWNV